MDKIDKEILKGLKEDGRMSYAAIAKRVGLTSTAVGQRVQKLLDEGEIKGFSVLLDHEKLGIHMEAIISLRLNFAQIDKFYEVLKAKDEIESCYRVTGEDCIIMKTNLRDNAHLLEFINQISLYGFSKSSIVIEQIV